MTSIVEDGKNFVNVGQGLLVSTDRLNQIAESLREKIAHRSPHRFANAIVYPDGVKHLRSRGDYYLGAYVEGHQSDDGSLAIVFQADMPTETFERLAAQDAHV